MVGGWKVVGGGGECPLHVCEGWQGIHSIYVHACLRACILFSWLDGQIFVPCRHRHPKTHNHLLVFMKNEKEEN